MVRGRGSRRTCATIDGRPAFGRDVQLLPERACQDLYPFDSGENWTCCWPDDPTSVRRMWAINVDGELVLVVTPFNATNMDERLELADALVDTIDFGGADASPGAPN